MLKEEIEKELKKRIEEGEKLEELSTLSGWKVLKEIFKTLIEELKDIRNIDEDKLTPEEIKARKIALNFLETFWGEINAKIEGTKDFKKHLENLKKESSHYIVRK